MVAHGSCKAAQAKSKIAAAFKRLDPSNLGMVGITEMLNIVAGLATSVTSQDEWMALVVRSGAGIIRYHSFLDFVLSDSGLPQQMNWRPPQFFGRDELETKMASPNAKDWVEITEMLLGPVPDGFNFMPKHKSSSWAENPAESVQADAHDGQG